MIFYFSGTGNSKRIAECLAKELNETTICINHSTFIPTPPLSGETLGFVCPVYGWGLPIFVEKFIKKLPPAYFSEDIYTYFVLTCGDDIGRTDRLIHKLWNVVSTNKVNVFSVKMRNTYICLPGFELDSPNIEKQKESLAQKTILDIVSSIRLRRNTTPDDVTPGSFPWIKSYILRPIFNKYLIKDKYFHVNPNACIHCARCMLICPTDNIRLNASKLPEWNGNCTHCLACYHICPHHAINYGKYTKSKGQVKINF